MLRNPSVRRPVRRPRPHLSIQSFEDRVVPANNLSVGNTFSLNVVFDQVGSVITVRTSGGTAQLDIDDLESTLKTPGVTEVILSTSVGLGGFDNNEAGNITWDRTFIGRDLSTIGVDSGTTLSFKPDAASPIGQITISGAAFGTAPTGGSINLDFNTSAVVAAAGGDIVFQPGPFGSAVSFGPQILDLNVRSNNGSISYEDGLGGGPVRVSGIAGFVTLDAITLANSGGINAGNSIGIGGSTVTISGGSTLKAAYDLSIASLGAVNAGGINLTSDYSTIAVNGTTVTMGGTIHSFDQIAIQASSGAVTLGYSNLQSFESSISITGIGAINFGGSARALGSVTFSPGAGGAITLTSFTNVVADQIFFNGKVDGAVNLTLDAGSTKFLGAIGGTATLNTLNLQSGTLTTAGNAISASEFLVGVMPSGPTEATLGGDIGVIHSKVQVGFAGNLAPGGIGAIGIMTIDGDLVFESGDYALDVTANTADRINLIGSGNLYIYNGRLGNETSTGTRTEVGNETILSYQGTLTGTFANAPLNKPFFFNGDALQVTNYDTIVTIALAGANPGNTSTGGDQDGTNFTAKMTGPGELIAFVDTNQFLNIVTRNTTTSSNVMLTVKANASDDLVKVANVSINGALGKFLSPAADVSGTFKATGTIKSISIHDLMFLGNTAAIGGAATDKTTWKANNLEGTFTTPGQLTLMTAGNEALDIVAGGGIGSIKAQSISGIINSAGFAVGALTASQDFAASITAKSVASVKAANLSTFLINTTEDVGSLTASGNIFGQVTARALGAVKAGTTVSGSNNWFIFEGVKSLKAGAFSNFQLYAKFVGSVSAMGNATQHLSGNIYASAFHLSGDDGTPAHNALKSLTAKGTVQYSLIKAEEGNVGTVTVGRFLQSQIYLDYSQTYPFEDPAGFNSQGHFKLGKFTTTASTLGDAGNQFNYAFANSEIAADTIGKVRISSLKTNNNGSHFGIKFQTSGGSVQVKTADDPAILPNKDLTADGGTQVGDFFYLDV